MLKKIAVAFVAAALFVATAVEADAGRFRGQRNANNRGNVVVNVNGNRNVSRGRVFVNVNGNRGFRGFNNFHGFNGGINVRVNRGLFGPFNTSASVLVTDVHGNIFIVDAFGNTVKVGSNRSNFGRRVFNFNIGH